MNKKEVILVDKNDNQIGVGKKLRVHKEGKRHRSFSIFVFNAQGKVLFQKRADTKYHSPSLWSNTCCSHPRPDRDIKQEAITRLKQEMGFKCNLKEIFSIAFKAELGDLIENEIDHVFVGNFDGNPQPDPKEVEGWKWIGVKELKKDMVKHPEKYTYWSKIIFTKITRTMNRDGFHIHPSHE